jgi:hypothetical protein
MSEALPPEKSEFPPLDVMPCFIYDNEPWLSNPALPSDQVISIPGVIEHFTTIGDIF